MSDTKMPTATFFATSEKKPSIEGDVFIIGPNGEIATGSYVTWNGKSEWHVSAGVGHHFTPVWWAYKPNTSEGSTGYQQIAVKMQPTS